MRYTVSPHLIEENLPLIYMWEIRDNAGTLIGRYVGKAKGGSKRPRKHYSKNVRNILDGKVYRKSKPNAFRRIHLALAEAERNDHSIVLYFLYNILVHENINEVEQSFISQQNCKGVEAWQLNG
jgi:hypothetical protein